MKIITCLKVYICSLSLLICSSSALAEGEQVVGYNIKEFTLPSEVKDLPKSSGAVYFSPSVKGKVLIPVHFWGAVNRAGLHFVPVNTTFVNGLSMAGGPGSTADLKEVKLTRKNKETFETLKFNLTEGGSAKAYEETLRPGDSIFIPKDTFTENRAYYTGLIGVFATVLSSVLLYRQVKN